MLTRRCGGYRPGGRLRTAYSAHRGGQILVMVLLAMTLLVALVFYVYNVGDQVNQRLAMQNAADAAVISGSSWMARSMNVVAMNNCAESRMLALVPIDDSLPLSTRMALEEVTEWEKCLAAQLGRGVPNQSGEGPMIARGLESLRSRMAGQRDVLSPFNQMLNNGGFNMEEATQWSVRGVGGSPPHGGFWRAAVELERFSQAEVESCGVLAQADAVRFVRSNDVDAGFLVPLVPEMPAVPGRFESFQPVLQGREYVDGMSASTRTTGGAGGAIPDCVFPNGLGPWARLFQHRDYVRVATGWVDVPPSGPTVGVRGGNGAVGGGGRRVGSSARTSAGGGGGGRRVTSWEVRGYTTYGPYSWAMRRIWDYARDHYDDQGQWNSGYLSDTFFYEYVNSISGIKMGYMFGPKNPKEIHYPVWKTPYPEARKLAERKDVRVTKTMYYLVEIASSVPEGGAGWLSPGTFRANGERPVAIWFDGWQDPEKWGIPKVNDYTWKDKYTYEVTQDPQIGIRERLDPLTGEPIWQTVYMVAWYIFGGIDVGGEVEVSNPCNWDEYDELPRPYLLDRTQGDYDADQPDGDRGFRRERFTYLGVARRGNTAAVWSARFSTVHPLRSMVTMGQASVFNNRSFDLWTQDWQAQLVPVTQWDDWVRRLKDDLADVGRTQGMVEQEEAETILRFLSSLPAEMAEQYKCN